MNSVLLIAVLAVFVVTSILNCVETLRVAAASGPTITVNVPTQGRIQGNYDTTLWTNQLFMQFRGIPFARSPKGKLRFKPPVPSRRWRKTLDATNYGRRCPVLTTIAQLSEKELQEDLEDCLNLCVYTKNLDAKKPVMFYIHGGGFYNGSSVDHPPKFLLEKDIVLVVPQYRIGALGWASTLNGNMPGNVPVMDLHLALKWVQKNIRAFGGDPDNVTIFSQSAGTAMSGSLLLSPKTEKGLFKRLITQSGSILAKWAITVDPLQLTKRICEALECDRCESKRQLYKCMSAASVAQLLKVTQNESFSPIVGDANGVLPQHPSELFKEFNSPIPVMTGFTKDDGSFVVATYYDEMTKLYSNLSDVSVRSFVSGIMNMENDTTCLTNHLLMKLLFSKDLLDGFDHKKAIPAYFDLASTSFFKSPVIAVASQLVNKNLAPVYMYSFDYAGQHSRFGYEFGHEHYPFNGGVHHSNDNIYLFNMFELNEADTRFAMKMVDIWTSFAINGVPSVSGGPQILPMESENGPYFHINNEITIGYDNVGEFTATIDDPDNEKLDRKDIEF